MRITKTFKITVAPQSSGFLVSACFCNAGGETLEEAIEMLVEIMCQVRRKTANMADAQLGPRVRKQRDALKACIVLDE